MVSVTINENQSLKSIKTAFNSQFPHLKVEFFSEAHGVGEASSPKAMYDENLLLKDIRSIKESGDFSVNGNTSTSSFESGFFNHFGVTIQVFRKSGNIWLQTTTTDDWTLDEQEAKGIEFDS